MCTGGTNTATDWIQIKLAIVSFVYRGKLCTYVHGAYIIESSNREKEQRDSLSPGIKMLSS